MSPLFQAIGIFADEKEMDMLRALETHRDDENLQNKVKMVFENIADKIGKNISDISSPQIECVHLLKCYNPRSF